MKSEIVGWVWLVSCMGLLTVFLVSGDLKSLAVAIVLGFLGIRLVEDKDDHGR